LGLPSDGRASDGGGCLEIPKYVPGLGNGVMPKRETAQAIIRNHTEG
jgi:hypothetical protein